MRTHLQKNDGFTLIELLAVLVILSIVGTLVSSVLLNGINYSKKSEEQVSIQQEMNLFLTTITTSHETLTSYELVADHNPAANTIKLIGKDASGKIVRTAELSNENYVYSLYNHQGGRDVPLPASTTIQTSKPFYIHIIITSKKQPNQTYEIKTIISRL
ncbi:type II secretion system protein [Metabacillus indicus]|uniref:PulJ/GspJ family protein n=1 Tax=Metabacillus indicus TaxID=246786 RepID=UPI00316BF001